MSTPGTEPFPIVPGFTLEAEIGRGTSARVFRARQTALDRPVALKVITTLGDEGKRRALRLFREARLAGALDHRGIVRGIDAGDAGEFCWFAMELVEGRTLQQVLDEGGPLPWPRAVKIGIELLDALGHAHRRGIVHRDLKPSNILIDQQGHARVLDLGLARRDADPRLTHEGATVGTPKFMAPEQAREPQNIDARADLFSVGAVLYRAIGGVAPSEGETVAAVLTRLFYEDPMPLTALRPEIPPAVSLVIGKALEKKPEHRFADATAFSLALREAARAPAGSPAATWRWVAAVAAAIVIVALVVWYFRGSAAPLPAPPVVTLPPPPVTPAWKDFIPPAQPSLTPIERARAAIDFSATLPAGTGGQELDLALAPLAEELRLTAGKQRRAAREFGLSSGVAKAREVLQHARDRLLADVTADDGRPVHPLITGMIDRTVAEMQRQFDDDLSKEQADCQADIEKQLEELLTHPDAVSWTIADQGARVSDVLGHRVLMLEGDRLAAVTKKRDEILRRLAEVPVHAAERALARARDLIEERKYRAAREMVESLTNAEREIVAPGAAVQARQLLAAVESAEAKFVAEVEAVPDLLLRGSAAALDAAGRRLRVEQARLAIGGLAAREAEIPAARARLTLARDLLAVAESALLLREDLLNRIGGAPPPPVPVTVRTRAMSPVIGVEESGARVVARDGSRIVFKVGPEGTRVVREVEQLTAMTLAEILRLYGADPSPLALALLDHWDGMDPFASGRLEREPRSPARDWLLAAVDAAVGDALARYDSEDERTAFRTLMQLTRRYAEGAYGTALKLAQSLLADNRLAPTPFMQRHRAEIERIVRRSQAKETASRRLDPFGAAAEVRDARRGVVRLAWSFLGGPPPAGLLPPIGGEFTPQGLQWPGQRTDAALLPERSAALRLSLPEGLAALPFTLDVELRRERQVPLQFITVSYADLTFLMVGELRDTGAFAGVPLHGLERDLVKVQAIDLVAFASAPIAEIRQQLRTVGRPLTAQVKGETIHLGITSAPEGISASFDEQRVSFVGERRAVKGPVDLEIRLPPGAVLRRLSIELPLLPEEEK